MFSWEPIEKLKRVDPNLYSKMGPVLFGIVGQQTRVVGWWHAVHDEWEDANGDRFEFNPTHFHIIEPLP